MSEVILKVEDLSKLYRLGEVGTGTLSHDLNRWFAKIRGKEDPYSKVGQTNHRSQAADSDYVWALKDINFELRKGEVLGVIGKNGAGKSTLLKILSKVTGPTTGNVSIKGRVASLLEVGTGMHPELTARENIFLNGAILGMTKTEIRSKFDEIVDFAGIEMYIDTPVKRFSSGMRVRLGFAVAAFLEPEILIVDEVLAVGDAEFQKKAIGKMREVSQGDGRSVLFVSHNMASVKSLCTSGIILANGTVKYTGTAEDAVSEYLRGESSSKSEDIRNLKDRRGNGKLQFVDFVTKDKDGLKIQDVISGEPVTFELHYETKGTIDPRKLVVGLIFRDENHNNTLAFTSDEMNCSFNALTQKGHITLNLDRLNLRGEVYTVKLLAFEGKPSQENALDVIDNATELNVLPGDINKIGIVNRRGYGVVVPGIFEN